MRPAHLVLALLALPVAHAGGPAPGPRSQPLPFPGSPPRKAASADGPELPELATQAHVYSATSRALNDEAWVDGCLNLDLDIERFGCRIVAYRIHWFTGKWSGWFVPGVNDLYKKPGEPLRRFWACFNDHDFEIIYRTHGNPIDFAGRAQETPP